MHNGLLKLFPGWRSKCRLHLGSPASPLRSSTAACIGTPVAHAFHLKSSWFPTMLPQLPIWPQAEFTM